MQSSDDELDQLSVAALSASCIAAAVSLMLVAGTYDWFSVVISGTLVAIIWGSLRQTPRSSRASLAVSASIALSLLPLTGFLFEVLVAPNGLRVQMLIGEWTPTEDCLQSQFVPRYRCIEEVAQSNVWSSVQFAVWLLLLLAIHGVFGWRRGYSAGAKDSRAQRSE